MAAGRRADRRSIATLSGGVLLPPNPLTRAPGAGQFRRLLQAIGKMGTIVMAGARADREKKVLELLAVKNDFLHQTIHDLRRPLGVARGYLSMIEDWSVTDPVILRNGCVAAVAALSEMTALLDGLACVVQLDDAAAVLNRASCKVHGVVAKAVDSLRGDAEARSIKLELQADPALEVTADAARLRIAVANLLQNAIKYAPADSTISVEARAGVDGVCISVADQGSGIAPAEAERVFEKHWRGAGAEANPDGLGLGLYIVRRIVELHGGLVRLESVPGRGSTFTIVLPP